MHIFSSFQFLASIAYRLPYSLKCQNKHDTLTPTNTHTLAPHTLLTIIIATVCIATPTCSSIKHNLHFVTNLAKKALYFGYFYDHKDGTRPPPARKQSMNIWLGKILVNDRWLQPFFSSIFISLQSKFQFQLLAIAQFYP